MNDITMCTNEHCIKKEQCYRTKAESKSIWQSWTEFEPENNMEEKFYCDAFWEIK